MDYWVGSNTDLIQRFDILDTDLLVAGYYNEVDRLQQLDETHNTFTSAYLMVCNLIGHFLIPFNPLARPKQIVKFLQHMTPGSQR